MEQLRTQIVQLKNEGKSYRQIAKIVERPRSTVINVIKNFNKNKKNIESKPRSGRPKILNECEEIAIIAEYRKNSKTTAIQEAKAAIEKTLRQSPW